METKDVALFLAVTRIGSISRTAEQMFMSQSTVTARIQRLERTLGYELFHRTPSGVALTSPGEKFLPLAEQLMSVEHKMASPNETDVPVLRVISGRAFVSTDVPECLQRMLKRVNVHLQVRMGLYEDMFDALLAQQVDFCFLGEPIYHPQVVQLEFAPDSIDLVVPAHHYFAHDFPGIRALADVPFIAFGRPNAPFRKRIMAALAHSGVYPKVRMELDSIDGVKAMVGHGLGISFLPRRTLRDAASKNCAVIPMHGQEWTRPTLLCFPEAIRDRPLTQEFVHVARSFYSEMKPLTHS